MIDADRSFSRDALLAEIAERFGPAVRFHTCSAEGMTAGELIEFLESRGKFLSDGGGWRVDEGEICNDGE